MGTCAPKYINKGCISNAMKDRQVLIVISIHSEETNKCFQDQLDHEIKKQFHGQSQPEDFFKDQLLGSKYYMNKVVPGLYIQDEMLGVLNQKYPLDVTILYEKEPNTQKFEMLVHFENQTDQAKMRKCVWEDENKEVRVSDLAEGPDFWRLAANSEQRNYPVGRSCQVCHNTKRCQKNCQRWKDDGGHVQV